jgi:hypothetical protein
VIKGMGPRGQPSQAVDRFCTSIEMWIGHPEHPRSRCGPCFQKVEIPSVEKVELENYYPATNPQIFLHNSITEQINGLDTGDRPIRDRRDDDHHRQ